MTPSAVSALVVASAKLRLRSSNTAGSALGRRRLDQTDIQTDAVERDCEAGADQATTDDHDFVLGGV